MKKILLYPGWLRTWHWVNALFFVVLIWTGVELHFATPGTAGLGFSRSRVLHNTVGILLTFNYLVFVLGNLISGNGKYYILNFGKVSKGLLQQFHYYALGIFRGDPNPYPHSKERKFNPLQKITYTIVMYMIMPIMMISGWLVFFPDKIPEQILGISGRLLYAHTHTLLGYLLGLFMMVHIYLGTTGDTPSELYKGIITGWVPAHEESDK